MANFQDNNAPSLSAPGKTAEAELARTVMTKVRLRLLPFLFLLYVINILDRGNVGFGKLTMLSDLGLSKAEGEQVFSLGSSIFYIGYILFEVPSNLILHRVGARIWIGRIMVSWGLVSSAMLLVVGPWSFYTLRFTLGVAEAGFFPGIVLYLSYWFPARERARAVALFMMASPVSGIIGNPLSGALLELADGWGGLHGWQWMFLVEGIPAVILGFLVWLYLTDYPEQADWLTAQERDWLSTHLKQQTQLATVKHGLTNLGALVSGRVWLLILVYFTVAVASNVFGFYAPSVIEASFPGLSKIRIGLLAAVPNIAALVAMLLVGTHSDRTGERRWHVVGAATVAATGWMVCALASNPWVVLLGLTIAQAGIMSILPTFWALATSLLSGKAAAGGIALINSMGNVGGFAGPFGFGQLQAHVQGHLTGMVIIAGMLVGGALVTLCVRPAPKQEKAVEAPLGEERT